MGQDIDRAEFSSDDYQRFRHRLNENLSALEQVLAQPGFGEGPASIGAELELYICDESGRPLLINQALLAQMDEPDLALELNRYNLEYNLPPVEAGGTPFSALEQTMEQALARIRLAAADWQATVIPIGILPTLKRRHFGPAAMTDQPRFHALNRALARMRGELFSVRIDGPEPICLRSRDVTLEGANTSMQVHYRILPERFADLYNALQMATPVVVACAGNSPFMLGQRLWQETRIPLIKHAIDGRTRDVRESHLPSRVSFGHGWVRQGAAELFAETIHLHQPILPICADESPQQALDEGRIPALDELRLHQGTVWPWNRPVFDPTDGGHLRIEMRALPAGPTSCDMMANAAFLIGLAEGLSNDMEVRIPSMPFQAVEHNFYRAAQQGLNARMLWPDPDGRQPLMRLSAAELVLHLLPLAEEGLLQMGVDAGEAEHYLHIIRSRVKRRQTGAVWQQRTFRRLLQGGPRHRALSEMVKDYIRHSEQNRPVSGWR